MKKYIAFQIQKPVTLPIQGTCFWSFLMYYFNAPALLWGVFITVFSVVWICLFVLKFYETVVKIDADKLKELAEKKDKNV